MSKPDGSRTASPYDLNATLKDRKPTDQKSPSPSARSPYTLSHESSLRTIILPSKKR
jgi:hypothetical protein